MVGDEQVARIEEFGRVVVVLDSFKLVDVLEDVSSFGPSSRFGGAAQAGRR
jgi:hypothetical protein